MYVTNFELEAITPIFMRGADQRNAEIRASSIKGLMRWWFRALAGNYFGNDIAGLRKVENYAFGSTSKKSRVEIRVNCDQKPRNIVFKFRSNKPIFDRDSHVHELSYLWFSLKLLASKKQIEKYYPAGTNFKVTIKSYDSKTFNLALTSLWALVSLGSIGFRNRRGAGSLKFSGGDLEYLNGLGLKPIFRKIEDLEDSIRCAIDVVGKNLPSKLKKLSILTPASYAILSENTSYVGLWRSHGNMPIELLKDYQSKYEAFRRSRQHSTTRITFGLPIVRSNIRGSLGRVIKDARRASPMFIGVIKVGHENYVRITKFKTDQFYPNDIVNSQANWSILNDFNERLGEIDVFGSLEVFK